MKLSLPYPVSTPPSEHLTRSLHPSTASGKSTLALSQRERDIFSIVEFDLETPAAAVAKKLRIPVASVHYTLKKLRESDLVKPRCFINSCQLGLLDIGFYFSLAEQSKRSREALIQRFRNHRCVAHLGSVLGDFQYVAVFMCRDLSHFSELISELTGSRDEVISDKQIVPRLAVTRFNRKYLSPKLAKSRSMELRAQGAPIELDDTDTKLVWALGNRPYESIRELARFLGLPLATVDRRMKRLQENGVVQGLFYDLDTTKIGVHSFRVLVTIQGLSCSVRSEFVKVSAQHPLVTYLVEALGSWDFELGIETFDPRLVSSVVEELHTKTGGRISNVRVLMELEDFMCRHYPGKLGSGGAPR
jgi:DNA-binding Lrp family transcriptional regulator